MTPKEKAEYLLNEMYYSSRYDKHERYIPKLAFERAKQYALICCNEVLGDMGADRGYTFWQEVKQEIEKL